MTTHQIRPNLTVQTEPLTPLDYGAGAVGLGLCKNIMEVDSLRRAYYLGHEASRCTFYGPNTTVVVSPFLQYWHVSVFEKDLAESRHVPSYDERFVAD